MLKKCISVLLVVLLALSTVSFCVSAETQECTCGKPPLVYVVGQMNIYDDPTSPDRKLIPGEPTKDEITTAIKTCLSTLLKAIVTDQWDDYCDALYNAIAPYYEDFRLDNEGNVKNSSGPAYTWSYETISENHSDDNVFVYEYRYDYRLDPWQIADDLNAYIQTVKEKTHHSQVSLMSRCMGTAIAMAYLVKYGEQNDFADICSYVYYDSTAMGFSLTNGAFTGQLAVDTGSISRYAMEALGDDTLNELLKATIDLLQKTYGFELPAAIITKIYSKVYANVMPRILRVSYGSTPGFWGMVSDPYYEPAKEFVFGEQAADFSVLIDKIDFYHENVQRRIPEVLLKLKNAGKSVGIVCKYGFQMPPLVEDSAVQSDNLIDVYSQSHGATCARMGETFSEEYMANAEAAGTVRYISPDRVIDASTCLLPDNTWFVKNVEHMKMPQGVDPLLISIARSKTPMTVTSDPNFPQYMLYDADSDSISPLTEDNCNTSGKTDYNFFEAVVRFFKAFFALIKEKLAPIFSQA